MRTLPILALAGLIAATGCAHTPAPATQKPVLGSDDRWLEEGRPLPTSNPVQMPVVDTPVCKPGDTCASNTACCPNQAPTLLNDGLKEDMDDGVTLGAEATVAKLRRLQVELEEHNDGLDSSRHHPETTVCIDGTKHPSAKPIEGEVHCLEEYTLGWFVASTGRGNLAKTEFWVRQTQLVALLKEIETQLNTKRPSRQLLKWMEVVATAAKQQLVEVTNEIAADKASEAELRKRVGDILESVGAARAKDEKK